MGKPIFLAAGHGGVRVVSRDGRMWGERVSGKDGEVFRAAAVGNGRLVAVGTYGGLQILASAAPGGTWKQTTRDGGYGAYLRGLNFVNGRFLGLGGDPGAVGAANPYVLASPDGETWEPFKVGGKFMIRRVAFGNGVYVGVGDRGRRAVSADAAVWKDAPAVKATETLIDVAFGNGAFVGVGLHGLRLRTEDGATWTDRQVGEEGEHLNAVVWAKDRFVAVGTTVTYQSRDGRRWERQANVNGPLTMTHGDGVFVGVRWKGRLLRSIDAVRWEEVYRDAQHLEAVAFGEM